jgi:signal transduction histidine kinase
VTLRTRLLLALAYVLILAVVALELPLATSLGDRVDAEVKSQARGQADVVAKSSEDLVLPTDARRLARLAQSAGRSARGRVVIVNRRGRLVADSAGRGLLGRSYASRPEIRSALTGRSVQERRHSDSLNAEILATAVPVVQRGATVGAVRVTQNVDSVSHAVRTNTLRLALLGAVVLLLGLGAGLIIAGQVTRPLRRLRDTALRIAGGDLDSRARVEGSTEQRSLASSFNVMTERLSAALKSQQLFVADASHQLRTPLTGLRLRLEEARAECPAGNGAAAELDEGMREIDRLSAIVDELLVLSQSGASDGQAQSVEIEETARRLVGRWAALAEERGVRLALEPGPDGGEAHCDPADLDRALDALVENAVRYTPPGGRVTVRTGLGSVEILDEGPGLAEGEDVLVFERFHRGVAGRDGPSGSGLGLAIARQLSERWGGHVTLENRTAAGVRAALTIPVMERV